MGMSELGKQPLLSGLEGNIPFLTKPRSGQGGLCQLRSQHALSLATWRSSIDEADWLWPGGMGQAAAESKPKGFFDKPGKVS